MLRRLQRMAPTDMQRLAAKHVPTDTATSATKAASGRLQRLWALSRRLMTKRLAIPLPFVLFGANATMQHYLGSQENFFYGKFTTKKDPDDLAEFYQAEELLKILMIHPILMNFFMNKVEWDTNEPTEETALLSTEEQRANVKFLGMEISFEIIQEEEEIDGETKLRSFQRHERFIDWVPIFADYGIKQLLWDQTWIFGFNVLDDGTVEVYHQGEKFVGPWIVRIIVFFHQYYGLWMCEKFINGASFGTEDIDKQQEELANMPLHLFKEFVSKLQKEKEKTLTDLKSEPKPDAEAIAKTTEALSMLKSLSQSNKSTISVAKRTGVSGSMARPGGMALKVVAEDKATQKALALAMTDGQGLKDKGVDAAFKEVMRSPELEFKKRATSVKKTVKKVVKSE